MSPASVASHHPVDPSRTPRVTSSPPSPRSRARSLVTLLLTVAVVAIIGYAAPSVLSGFLEDYRFRAPYALTAMDAPFAIVAIGVGYLCLERHRLRNDVQSAALGTM